MKLNLERRWLHKMLLFSMVDNDERWNIYEIIHICTAVVDESEVWSSQ